MNAVDTIRDALFGNPPVPSFKPSREGVLNAFIELYNQLSNLISNIQSYATVSILPSSGTTAPIGTQARVYADGTTSNNTYWIRKALTGTNNGWQIDTDLIASLASIVQPLVTLARNWASQASGPVDNTGYPGLLSAFAYSKLSGHYANDSTDVDVPGGSAGERGAKYWANLSAATIPLVNSIIALIPSLQSSIQQSPISLAAGMADSLSAERMLDPATFIDKIMGVNSTGRGGRSHKAIQSFDYLSTTLTTDTTVLFRNGQQHLLTPPSSAAINIGDATHRTSIAGYGPEGNYGACLDTRMDFSTQTWVASGGGYDATITLRNSLDFGIAGANIAGVHLMLWRVSAPHDDALGSLCELKIGGANPAANDAAVDATTGVDAWSIKYAGQIAGDIRGLAHVGSTYIFHVKTADGSSPAGKPFFFADCKGGVVVTSGSHGHVLIIGTAGKDSASFTPMGNATLGLIPWFESLTMLGVGGHGGVGPKCTVGAFTAIGVPIPGEVTYAAGQTGGAGCHNFSAGFDLSNQYLYNGSIYTENFAIAGCYAHGGGSGSEAYRGWNVGGDIVQVNCTSGFEIEITLNEGFKHFGRLILTGGQFCVNSYPGQYFQLAGRGGLFLPNDNQITLVSFTNGGARTVVIGSDNPDEIFVLDASNVNSASPVFHTALLVSRVLVDSAAPPTLILKHVEDRTPIVSGITRKFGLPQVGFNPNGPFVNLTLIGTKLGDMWPQFDFADWPKSLYVDGKSEIGFYGRHWAAIEAAMAALGNPCTILPGAKAVDNTGAVVDIKT